MYVCMYVCIYIYICINNCISVYFFSLSCGRSLRCRFFRATALLSFQRLFNIFFLFKEYMFVCMLYVIF